MRGWLGSNHYGGIARGLEAFREIVTIDWTVLKWRRILRLVYKQ
jgi:hypothetical protein